MGVAGVVVKTPSESCFRPNTYVHRRYKIPQGLDASNFAFNLIPERFQQAFDSSSTFGNVHHSNEPHVLGSANESRVDTEV